MNDYGTYGAYRPGEIHLCSIPYATGHEIQKNRPAVIVSDEGFNSTDGVVWVVMCSASDHDGRRNCVPVSGLDRESWALCGQLYAVDKSRLIHYICTLPPKELEAVRSEVRRHMGGDPEQKAVQESATAELTKAQAERDTYKELYTDLLARIIAGGGIGGKKYMRNISLRELFGLRNKAAAEAEDAERERQAVRRSIDTAKRFRAKLEAAGISYQKYTELEDEAIELSEMSRKVLVALERGEGIPT